MQSEQHMRITSGYKSFELYNLSKKLVLACYELTHDLPAEEKTNFKRYMRTAALSLHVNIALGISTGSKKRRKYHRNAKTALIIIDAATEILIDLQLATPEQVAVLTGLTSSCYQLLDEL